MVIYIEYLHAGIYAGISMAMSILLNDYSIFPG